MSSSTHRYRVLGKVQGVGYRYFAARIARELQLAGWVRNLADGSVEAVACGPVTHLNRFAAELHIGPPRAEVRHVQVQEWAPDLKPDLKVDAKIEGFHIR
ncbi:MAG: acylphosphatase [Acidobacteriota bacterium]